MDHRLQTLLQLDDRHLQDTLEHTNLKQCLDNWDLLSQEQSLRFFQCLPKKIQNDLIIELPDQQSRHLLTNLPPELLLPLLNKLQPDDLTDLIQQAPTELSNKLWVFLSPKLKAELQRLLIYDENQTGSLMTTRYMSILETLTIHQAIQSIRNYLNFIEKSYYIYVIDSQGFLTGVTSLKELLLGRDEDIVSSIMHSKVLSVNANDDPKISSEVFEEAQYPSLPVVNQYNQLIGILTFDDVIDFIRTEETEEIYKMGGMSANSLSYLESNVWQLILKRLPWLLFLLLTGTFTSNVLQHYEYLFQSIVLLALFIPVITQTGGNSGTQSSTLIIRGLAMSEIKVRDTLKVIIKESLIGLVIGVVSGLTIMLRGILFSPKTSLIEGVVIGTSLMCIIVFASITGALIPMLLARIGKDPTVAAGPLMSTLIDISGLTIYFSLAKLILPRVLG